MTRFLQWLRAQRSSTRLSFLLQILTRAGFALFSLLWAPLLLVSMGKSLNGLFLNFQSITTLGNLGDLGMGGVVNIRTSRLLGERDEAALSPVRLEKLDYALGGLHNFIYCRTINRKSPLVKRFIVVQ